MTRSRRDVYYHKQRYLQDVKVGYRLERKNGNRYNRHMRYHKTDDLGEIKAYKYLEVKTCW